MEIFLEPLIKPIGWSMVNNLWQSAVIYAFLLVLFLMLPKLKAKHKHNIAFSAILFMFISFCATFISLLSKTAASIGNFQENSGQLYMADPSTHLIHKIERYFPLLVSFYILGILLQIFVIIKGYNKLNRLRSKNISAATQEWYSIFEKTLAHLGIVKKVKFYISASVNIPLVIGYLKPVVLFPIALVNQLNNDQVEAILIHELSHIRRNDFLLNLIKTTVETLLFFNPFVWLAGKFIGMEREHACDDLVVKITGQPLKYAETLLKLEILKDKNAEKLTIAATGNGQNLYHRIKRITNMKTNYLNAKQQMAALTLGLACLCSIAWVNPKEESQKHTSNKLHSLLTLTKDTTKAVLAMDTPIKKRKVQIITKDDKGEKIIYNSIAKVPDSLKINFKFNPEINKVIEDAKKQALEIKKEFSSEKWKKEQEELKKQLSFIDLKNLNKEVFTEIDMSKILSEVDILKERAAISGLKTDSVNKFLFEFSTPQTNIYFYDDQPVKKLRESQEYKKLKEKFDRDLNKLKSKMEKKDQKN